MPVDLNPEDWRPVADHGKVWRAYNAALAAPYRMRMRLELKDMRGHSIEALEDRLIDGQVDVDITRQVSHSLSATLTDPDGSLAGMLTDDTGKRVLRAVHGVWLTEYGFWAECEVFTGPMTHVQATADQVQIEAHGFEAVGLGEAWRPRTYSKRSPVTDVIHSLLTDYMGLEDYQIHMPDKPHRLAHDLSIGRESKVWHAVRHQAYGLGYRTYFDGRGHFVMRRQPGPACWTFSDHGDAPMLTSPPQRTADASQIVNVVWVTGGKPKSKHPKKRPSNDRPNVQAWAVLPSSHPWAPWRMGHNTKPLYHVQKISAPHLRTRDACQRRAQEELDHLTGVSRVQVQCEGMVVPHLEPWDVLRIDSSVYSATMRLKQFTIPLKAGDPMSLGFNRRVSNMSPHRYRRGHPG